MSKRNEPGSADIFIDEMYIYTVSQKTSPTFLAITRKSIDRFFL